MTEDFTEEGKEKEKMGEGDNFGYFDEKGKGSAALKQTNHSHIPKHKSICGSIGREMVVPKE